MTVDHVEVIVEETSMEVALRLLLPRIIGDLPFEIRPYQGKNDLMQRLPSRLRGYAAWLPETSRILVVVDRDDDDCQNLKSKLDKMATDARLVTRTKSRGKRFDVVNRIAIEELEAWFFGDWEAVQAAYPRVSATIPNQTSYRDPDAIAGGTWEALERILQKAGYFVTGLPKIEAARTIAASMVPARNRSRSFQALRNALLDMTA